MRRDPKPFQRCQECSKRAGGRRCQHCGCDKVAWSFVAIAEHGSAKAALLAEIARSDLVCANCHAKRTFSRHKMERAPWCRHYEVIDREMAVEE